MNHFFLHTGFGLLLLTVLETLAMLVPLLVGVAYLTYAERKVLAAIQLRRGPNTVGPFGLLQAFADAIKMLTKETVIPSGANRVLFLLAPVLTFSLAMIAWAVIPTNNHWAVADINVGILYLFAISSLGVYGILIAGWASNSKYAFMGGLRSAAQMVSYEVSIGLVMVSVLLCVGSLNLNDIVLAQRGMSGSRCRCSRCSSCSSSPPWPRPTGHRSTCRRARASWSPASSSNTARSPFGLFFLGEYANMFLMSAMTTILFLGGWLPPVGHCAVHLDPGADLVHRQDPVRAVHVHLGAGHLSALPLRPADAPGLEDLPAVLAGLDGADRRIPDGDRPASAWGVVECQRNPFI